MSSNYNIKLRTFYTSRMTPICQSEDDSTTTSKRTESDTESNDECLLSTIEAYTDAACGSTITQTTCFDPKVERSDYEGEGEYF